MLDQSRFVWLGIATGFLVGALVAAILGIGGAANGFVGILLVGAAGAYVGYKLGKSFEKLRRKAD